MSFILGILTAGLLSTAMAAQTDSTIPPASARPLIMLSGVGIQKYICKNETGSPIWTFVAPQATLSDHGKEIGTHSAGPVWTLKDGGWVKGQVLTTMPSPDASSIPWLLLKTSETNGLGRLAAVKYIRRSDTVGGKARTTGCDAEHLGTTDEVPYRATYSFYSSDQ